jgi:hypothetical protein
MTNQIHKLDIGRKFRITVGNNGTPINISTATTKSIIFQRPDGRAITQTATFDSDGSDGKIYYTTIANDLDREGTWKIQAFISMGGNALRTQWTTFVVYSNIDG